MDEKIAIILVNYNGKDYNEECIKSILNSTTKNYEIIVVDNDSKDNSIELIREKFNDKVKLILAGENLGFSGANNLAIEYAIENNFDYVMLLNNDTVIDKNMISIMLDRSRYGNYIISPKIYYYDNRDIIWSAGGTINWRKGLPIQYGINDKDNNEINEGKKIEFATGCCILIPMKCIKEVGLLSEEYFLYYEDTDYSTRILEKNFEIVYEPRAIMYHKVSASTGGEKSELYWYYMTRNRLIFNKKFNKNTILYKIYFGCTMAIKIPVYFVTGNRKALYGSIKGICDYMKGIYGKKIFNND